MNDLRTWFEVVLFMALLAALIVSSYIAGRLNLLGEIERRLRKWNEEHGRDA